MRITADMYTYTAGATGLDAAMPPWVQEGGLEAWIARLKDPAIRARVIAEMRTPRKRLGESAAASPAAPDKVLLVGSRTRSSSRSPARRSPRSRKMRGKSPEETAIDLVIEDGTPRRHVVYFLMSEDNVRREAGLPWMSFGSDDGARRRPKACS